MLGIFLDIETTGLDASRHVTVDIAFRILDLSTGVEKASYQSIVKQPEELWNRADPSSLQVNGYTWDKVLTGKAPELVKSEVLKIFLDAGIQRGQAVFICQNPAFDRGFFSQIVDVYTQERLNWPYHWLDFASMYWALLCNQAKEGKLSLPQTINLSKNAIGKTRGIPPEEMPHRAFNGVDHLILCYRTVVGFPESTAAQGQGSG
jgi:oligoribonuclease